MIYIGEVTNIQINGYTQYIPGFVLFVVFTSLSITFLCLLVFYATFNNISVISWWSVLLVEETEGPGKNHQPVASH